jgi:hypothetical protein
VLQVRKLIVSCGTTIAQLMGATIVEKEPLQKFCKVDSGGPPFSRIATTLLRSVTNAKRQVTSKRGTRCPFHESLKLNHSIVGASTLWDLSLPLILFSIFLFVFTMSQNGLKRYHVLLMMPKLLLTSCIKTFSLGLEHLES